jgi:hypothetical protein
MPAVTFYGKLTIKSFSIMSTLKILKIRSKRYHLALLVGCALMLFSGTAFAQDPAPKKKETKKIQQGTLKEAKVVARIVTTVEEMGPMKIRLNVLNPTGKTVRISILNYQNQAVFQDGFREREYNKVLNFNSAIPGQYSLHVAGRKSSEVHRFKIDDQEKRDMTPAALENQKDSDVKATIYKVSPTKLMLHLVNSTGKPVEYIFRNSAQEVIQRGYVKEEKFSKAFDMSGVKDGKYLVEVKYLTDKAASRVFDVSTVYEKSFEWTDKRGRPVKPIE